MTAPCLTNVSEEICAQLRQSQKPVISRPESQVEEGRFLCTLCLNLTKSSNDQMIQGQPYTTTRSTLKLGTEAYLNGSGYSLEPQNLSHEPKRCVISTQHLSPQ